MNEAADISRMLARVAGTQRKATPEPETGQNNLFFPKTENAFTEVPMFKHRDLSDLQN